MLKLGCLFTQYCSDSGPGHILLSLCRNLYPDRFEVRMIVPNCAEDCRGADVVEAVPSFLKKIVYRHPAAPRLVTEQRFLKEIEDFDAVYLFAFRSLTTVERIKKYGCPIFIERANCFAGKSKRIVDEAYARMGARSDYRITEGGIRCEERDNLFADFFFCPSPEVKESFLEIGVPEEKLIQTSYGWSPQRFDLRASQRRLPKTEVTVLFVGRVCVRKGAHLLLQAWERAGIEGRLILCGDMEPIIAKTCGAILARSEVIHVPYRVDIGSLYSQADIFAFPSLEEGGPLVTYEAMAHGLPVLISPMGAGSIARDGIDGEIILPYETEAWVDALRRLSENIELRLQYGAAARARAQEFTWDKVAARRAELMLERIRASEFVRGL